MEEFIKITDIPKVTPTIEPVNIDNIDIFIQTVNKFILDVTKDGYSLEGSFMFNTMLDHIPKLNPEEFKTVRNKAYSSGWEIKQVIDNFYVNPSVSYYIKKFTLKNKYEIYGNI